MLHYEPFSERHLPALDAILEDPDVQRFTRVPVPPPPDFGATWVARYDEGRAEGTREAFAVVDEDDTLVGLAFAPTIDHAEGEAELGYLVTPAARGRGLATEILRWLTAWLFEAHPGVVRAYLIIQVDNPASEKVAQRAGYVREGVMRSKLIKDGRRADCLLYSRLAGDAA